MPVVVEKITSGKNKGKYRVRHGGKTSARATSKTNAERQARLLRGVEHGWKPTGAKARN